MNKLILFLVATLQISLVSAQYPGALDSSFNSNGEVVKDFGFNDSPNDVKIQSAVQKIVCTGVAFDQSYTGVLKVIRLNTDGSHDVQFGDSGVFSFSYGFDAYGYESQILTNGKIIVGGIVAVSQGYYDMLLLRLNSNGTLDSTFGVNGISITNNSTRDDFISALAVQPDGKIVVCGTIHDTTVYRNVPSILRFDENGFIDSTFGTNGIFQIIPVDSDNELTSIALQSDGKIVASGHFSNPFMGSYDFDVLVIRVDSTGAPDASFGTNGVVKTSINGGIDDCFGLQINAAGSIFVAGATQIPGTGGAFDMLLMKYKDDGQLDNSFGSSGIVTYHYGAEDVANDLEIQTDGKIVVGGEVGDPFLGPSSMALWRYLPDGTLDSAFGTNGLVQTDVNPTFQDITGLALQENGKIVAVGRTSSGSQNDIAILRYGVDVSTAIGRLDDEDGIVVYPNPSDGNIRITYGKDFTSEARLELFDAIGKTVWSQEFNKQATNNVFEVELPESLSDGVYFLVVSNDQICAQRKIVLVVDSW